MPSFDITNLEDKHTLMLELEDLAQIEGLRNFAKSGSELSISSKTQLLIDSKANEIDILRKDRIVDIGIGIASENLYVRRSGNGTIVGFYSNDTVLAVRIYGANATYGGIISCYGNDGTTEKIRFSGESKSWITNNFGIGTVSPTSKLQVVGLPIYADNASAVTGGLTAGAFYRTGGDPDLVCVVH